MKSHRNFSQQTQPICPHWTLNSSFCAFRTIWVHLWRFGCVTILSLKRVKLVEKFVTRSCVRIFRNERTRSTPMDPKLIFLCVSYYLSAVATVWLTRKTWWKCAELVRKFVPRSRIGTFRNEHTRSTPLDPKLMCLVHFILFRSICDHFVALKNSRQNGPN